MNIKEQIIGGAIDAFNFKYEEVCKNALLLHGFDFDKHSPEEIKSRCSMVYNGTNENLCLDGKPILFFYTMETFNGIDEMGNYSIKIERKYKLL